MCIIRYKYLEMKIFFLIIISFFCVVANDAQHHHMIIIDKSINRILPTLYPQCSSFFSVTPIFVHNGNILSCIESRTVLICFIFL